MLYHSINSRQLLRMACNKQLQGARKIILLARFVFPLLLFILWIGNINYAIETEGLQEALTICGEHFQDRRLYVQNWHLSDFKDLPMIYFVTPTHPRREQFAELTRLSHTLLHVPQLHWIVANDDDSCNGFIDDMLQKIGIPYTHLSSPMPEIFRNQKLKPRGVRNRRASLQWLRQRNISKGVLYFGDDDNTYDLKLFKEIRSTKRVSMFPVGLIGKYSISGPVVQNGRVIGFLDSWIADRRWPVDMAGFAVNMAYLAKYPKASMPYKPGYEEDFFLRSIALKFDYIEPKANNATEILVWHTQTKSSNRSIISISHEYLNDRTNLGKLFKKLEIMGMATISDSQGEKAVVSKNGKAEKLEEFF